MGNKTNLKGLKILFTYKLDYADFPGLTPGMAQQMKMPYEFAVCENEKEVSGISVYGRYCELWYQVKRFDPFLIKILLKQKQ